MEALKNSEYILSALKSASEEQGIEDYTITNVNTNEKGEGFSSKLFMVSIKDNHSERQLNFAVKVAFTEDPIRQMLPVRQYFENEIYFYSTVYPTLQQFAKEKKVSDSQFIPKCFKTSIEDHQELLVLENLLSSGFEIFDKKNFLDGDHVGKIFELYGRFHAYSFALRDQLPTVFEKLVKPTEKVFDMFLNSDLLANAIDGFAQQVTKCLIPGEDDEVIDAYANLYGTEGFSKSFKAIVTDRSEYSVLIHGDAWSNNMLFGYKTTPNGKTVEDMRFIDWQQSRLGHPVCDLAYLLYSSSSIEVYKDLDEYLKIYHKSFSTFLEKFGSDPRKLFPFDVFREEWRKYAKFGLFSGLGLLKLRMTQNNQEIPDFVEAKGSEDFAESMKAMMNVTFDEKRFAKAVRDLVCHLYKCNAL